MSTLSSGHWSGTCVDAFDYTATSEMDISVSGATVTGTLTIRLPSGEAIYTVSIAGTISGNQLTINEVPSSTTYLDAFWCDTPYSQVGALQAVFGTISPDATPSAEVSGGGTIILWYKG